MSLYSSFLLSDEQFQCSICLDVFTNPSSTPCGHSFCMACISRYWDGLKVCQCPLCKKTFQKRPDLQINRTLREITEQFKSMKGGGGGAGREKRGGKGDTGIPEDLYNELRRRLPRPLPSSEAPTHITPSLAPSVPNYSAIAALTSAIVPPPPPYPSNRSSGRRRFTLSGPESSWNLPICEVHHRGIMLYCRTDQMCICPECEEEDHPDHDTVTAESEWMNTKVLLSGSEQRIQEMIRQRLRKIDEIRTSVSELQLKVERETAGNVRLFSMLVSAIERSQAELMEVMEMSRRAAEHQADTMIRQLELEVEELRRRETVLAELAQSDDCIHCVKTFPTVSSPPPAKDWSAASVKSDLGTGTIYRSLAVLVEKFQEELKNVAENGFPGPVVEPSPIRSLPRMKRVQEYALDVTLDCNTAHPRLVLSEDMKSVRCADKHQLLPDNPERFDRVVCVLGREAITSGKHYWEVEVGGKTDWDLGVAKQSINRKGKIEYTPSNGYWFLSLRDKNKYAFRTEPSTDVNLNHRPHKIGIFVDFEKGQVSFYNVDARIHIYTFNVTFSESVFPFFSPCTNKSGKNDAPLIITPVNILE
ncbi:E3 ubiquitin-protein ligase TRIM7 [Amphiprion ocellaris]|uniref:E3 ubiquitin-protein ligase TRIM7 n=1 Tax=Amphiprion ocellaris TaxID=80972 RepID=UPI0024116E5C|nr:E3 ubiquitin-protein ligase TRIM7 [Amphiprion ocellaris]